MSKATVRLLIPDVDTPQVFTDQQIDAFLDLEASVKEAAAAALEVMASNEAMVAKKIKDQDFQTDGPAVAKELRERAASLRAQAAKVESDTDSAEFGIVTFNGDII